MIAGAPPATAVDGNVHCGDTITANTTLQADVVTATGGVCVGDGVIIGASGIALNLNGKKITGDGSVSVSVGTSTPNGANSVRIIGDAGVRIEGHSNVTIIDSTTSGGATGRDCRPDAAGWGDRRSPASTSGGSSSRATATPTTPTPTRPRLVPLPSRATKRRR